MARNDDGSGCGCLIIIILAFVIGGGFWQGIALLAAGWLGYLVFIGVSLGIILLIVKLISGD
jgi:hypothetical protein